MGIKVTGGVKVPQGKFSIGTIPAAVPSGKELWFWGENGFGQLGLGNTTDLSSPVQVGSLTDWANTDSGQSHSLAIKTDGTLWSWGDNSVNGQLGLGDIDDRSSPVQVGALTDWASVNARASHSHAIKTDGTMWSWGLGSSGQLGLGNITNYSSPIQVGALTTWSSVDAGTIRTFAIKTDGTLWAWGENGTAGALGLGDTSINRSSPVQVGNLTDWSTVSGGFFHTLAVKTDGTLWAWGGGSFGQLGQNNVIVHSSPVQIGSLTDWASVGSGNATSVARKTDGTIWAWGYRGSGQIGDGVNISRSSPVQIGVLTDWSSIVNYNGSLALKTDGTIWSWGRPNSGRLGDGTVVAKSSPVQIGSLTTWIGIAVGQNHSHALKTP